MDLFEIASIDPQRLKIVTGIGALVILGLFIMISIILVYHWKKYSIHKTTISLVMSVYFAVALLLFYTIAHSLIIIFGS